MRIMEVQHHQNHTSPSLSAKCPLQGVLTVFLAVPAAARLQIKDMGTGNISSVVHDVAQQLGLLSSLNKMARESAGLMKAC